MSEKLRITDCDRVEIAKAIEMAFYEGEEEGAAAVKKLLAAYDAMVAAPESNPDSGYKWTEYGWRPGKGFYQEEQE